MDYRIDDLAQAAGTTVRNVRVYQDRGLLPPPRREGRNGIYSDAHLARLRLVAQLLERGYTFAHIAEFLEAWQEGRDLTSLLGLEQVLTTSWSDELATWVTPAELEVLYGPLAPHELAEVVAQGLLVPDPGPGADRWRAPSPRLLHAGSELVQAGIPVAEVLVLSAQLAAAMDAVAARMVAVVEEHLDSAGLDSAAFDSAAFDSAAFDSAAFDSAAPDSAASDRGACDGAGAEQAADGPAAESVEQLAELVLRLKPLAQLAVDAHLARAMERRVGESLRERLGVRRPVDTELTTNH